MEIYKRILSCKDKNIKGLISKIIYKLTEEAWNDNCDDVSTIGCFPVKTSILDLESEGADYYNETPYWIGYIPLGMRVAYCMDIDFQGMYSDMGGYFVMNSDEYILEGEIDIEMPDYCIVETSDRFKKEVYFENGKRVYNIDWVDTKKLDNEPKVLILQNDK